MKVAVKLDGRFVKEARGQVQRYEFQVGVLDSGKAHKYPAKKNSRKVFGPGYGNLKTLAGGPARKVGRHESGKTIAEVSADLRKKTGVNFYTAPFKSKQNAEILRFLRAFFDLIKGKSQKKRLENTLQAIVRNPIVRGDYGSNSPAVAKAKGFNRLMIDTGQLFQAIKAKVIYRVSK